MKRQMLLAGLALLACEVGRAQSPEQAFQNANVLYQQGKIAEAREAYETLLRSGYVNGELLYNLGNASYRTGSIAHAILCYERSLRFLPGDEDLRHNLQLMNLMITDRIEPAPRLFLWEWWDGVKGSFSLRSVTWLAYGTLVLLAAGVVLFLLSRTYVVRRAGLLTALIGASAFLIFLVIFFGKFSDVTSTEWAIVMNEIVTVKNSPDAKSSDAFVLHAGVKVRVMDTVGGWVQVRLADGKVGWMEGTAVERI